VLPTLKDRPGKPSKSLTSPRQTLIVSFAVGKYAGICTQGDFD
jgi:hypothetical protein